MFHGTNYGTLAFCEATDPAEPTPTRTVHQKVTVINL